MNTILEVKMFSRIFKLIILIHIFLFFHNPLYGNTLYQENSGTENYTINIRKIDAALKIDGYLNEATWAEITPVAGFIQREPVEGSSASGKTEVKIFYDEDNIYFGVMCYDDEPEKIVANVLKRDAELENSDYFDIIMDTFHDHRNAFYFATTPLGAKRDVLIRDEGGNLNSDWNGIWECKAKILDAGWSAEFAIPFKTLRFREDEDSIWGINFGRMIARKKETSYWTPILRSYGFFGQFKISKFGHLNGLKSLKQGGKIEIRPYILGSMEKDYEENISDNRLTPGLDLKYRLTPNLTADFTYKTDFGQVESDQEQVNLTRFSLFFPEKRDFFLEGANIFRFGERFDPFDPGKNTFFFSRRIGISEDGEQIPLRGGVRVTGKVSDYTIGFLNLITDKTTYLDDDEKVTVPKTNYTVIRAKRDIFAKSSIGFIGLNKEAYDVDDYNRGIGIDANFSLYTNLQFGGFLAKTFSPGIKKKNYAGYFDFNYMSDFIFAQISYLDVAEDFDAQMGFIRRTDIKTFKLNLGFGPRPGILNIRQIFIGPQIGEYTTDHSNRLLSRNITPFFVIMLQDGTFIVVNFNNKYEYLDEDFEIRDNTIIPAGIYKFSDIFAMFNTDQSKSLYLKGIMMSGEFYNGKWLSLNLEPVIKPVFNFEISLRLARNYVNLPVENGKFNTDIIGTRLTYSFSPDLYAKLFAQYNTSDETGNINFLINYIYKPGMNFFLVYNEYYDKAIGGKGLKNRIFLTKINYVLNR